VAIMDPGFYQKLLEVSSEVQIKPEDLLNVMAVESGIDPTAHNANGNASGLLQFMPATLKGLGFHGTHADFRKMSSIDQLDYVKKLILNNMKYNGGPFTSAAQYYVANFLPVALKLPGIKEGDPSTIIVAKEPRAPHLPGISTHQESDFYNANPSLDFDKDGAITYGDIQSVLNRATAGKNYRSAIAQLQNSTGYKPSNTSPSMLAHLQKTPPANDVMSILNRYLQQVAASERNSKKLYKKYLPKNQLVIGVTAPTYSEAVEFSRVLSSALDEDLLADAFVHTDGQKVEVECCIHGPQEYCIEAVRQLTASLAKVFEIATKKVGSIKVNTQFFMNKKSSYQPISLKASSSEHRKFLLKFI
jgi:hypothetical protein